MTAIPIPQTEISPIRQHVEMIHSLAVGVDGVLVVSAYNALLEKGGTVTHHKVGDVDGMVEAIEAHQGTPNVNCYVGLQIMRPGLERGRRGTETDIVATLGLVADLDGDTGKVGSMPVEPNLVLKTSPGNYQPFILFDRPLPPSEAKPIAAALKRATNSDNGTADITHVWRVPNTKNWPNKKKLERGRSPDPVEVTVAQDWDGSLTSVGELCAALAPWWSAPAEERSVEIGELPDVDGLAVSEKAAALLAANNVGDRSAHAARVAEQLAFGGHSAEEALALFLAATGDWFSRYRDAAQARKDFERLFCKYASDPDDTPICQLGILVKPRLTPANDNRKDGDQWRGIVSSGDLVRGFRPPDYFLEGIAQCGFLYALTAMTGAGKTSVLLLLCALAAQGKPLGDREVRQGRALYFAGENPDDVTMRWIGMAHKMPFDPENIEVHFIKGTFSIPAMFKRIRDDVTRLGGVDVVVIDTSAAYFQGQEENSNTELGKHARELRALTTLPGSPCVLVAAHPTKNADQNNLLPRGGGAFLNELDGNLVLMKTADGAVKLHWHGKHRGPDFDPVPFELTTVTAPALRDSKGRDIPTVMASVISNGEARAKKVLARRDEDDVLLLIERDGKMSLNDMAEALGWLAGDGKPHKARVGRASTKLKAAKLVEYRERIGWSLTKPGGEAAVAVRGDRHREQNIASFMSKSRASYDEN